MHIMSRLIAVIIMFLSMQAVIASEAVERSIDQVSANARPATLPPAYPGWPERQARVNAVPPPPLGPYMSTGLQDAGQGFACCEEQRRNAMPTLDNMPWPERRRPPRQWLPEDGRYSFAPRDAVDTAPAQPARYGNWGWQPMYQQQPQGRYR